MAAPVSTTYQPWIGESDCRLDDFRAQVLRDTEPADYPLAADVPACHQPGRVQHVKRVVGNAFNQESEITFGFEEIPFLLLIFLEHPTARLIGANAQGANWFLKNQSF